MSECLRRVTCAPLWFVGALVCGAFLLLLLVGVWTDFRAWWCRQVHTWQAWRDARRSVLRDACGDCGHVYPGGYDPSYDCSHGWPCPTCGKVTPMVRVRMPR